MKYNSVTDTKKHIKRVNELVNDFNVKLKKRVKQHDNTKLKNPEKTLFDIYTPMLKGLTYGSKDYHKTLDKLKPALNHHFRHNSHHPEHYKNGIDGMNLFDIVEMFFDWKAASERHDDGNIYKSFEINKKRFNMSDQLKNIYVNTAKTLNYKK